MKNDFEIFRSLKQDISGGIQQLGSSGAKEYSAQKKPLETSNQIIRPKTAQAIRQFQEDRIDFSNILQTAKGIAGGSKRPQSISAISDFKSPPVEIPEYYQKLLKRKKEGLERDLHEIDRISVETFSNFRQRINLYNKYYTNFLIDPPDYLSNKDRHLGLKPFTLFEGIGNTSAPGGFKRQQQQQQQELIRNRKPSILEEEEVYSAGKHKHSTIKSEEISRKESILSEVFKPNAPSKKLERDKKEIDEIYEKKIASVQQDQHAFLNLNNRLMDQEPFGDLERNFFKAVKNGDLDSVRLLLHDKSSLIRARDEVCKDFFLFSYIL
jgi:hypothetical protein